MVKEERDQTIFPLVWRLDLCMTTMEMHPDPYVSNRACRAQLSWPVSMSLLLVTHTFLIPTSFCRPREAGQSSKFQVPTPCQWETRFTFMIDNQEKQVLDCHPRYPLRILSQPPTIINLTETRRKRTGEQMSALGYLQYDSKEAWTEKYFKVSLEIIIHKLFQVLCCTKDPSSSGHTLLEM